MTGESGMKRRDFIKATGIGTLAWGLRPVAAAERKGPNLLIIQTDEHLFRTLGCYGGRIVKTPNIDWIAENGALCTNFYATTPVCSPSRSSLVSGRYPQNTPVVTNDIPMSDEIITFAEILRRRGYATGYAGKWHLDGQGKPQWAPGRKFGFRDNRFMFNRGHWKKLEDTPQGPAVAAQDKKGNPSYAVDGADATSFTTDWLAGKALDFIRSHKDEPFCYMVSFPDPHGPNTVRAPYDTMFADVQVPIPASLDKTAEQTPKWAPKEKGVDAENLRKIMPPYYGMVRCIDDNVGRILGTLRQLDLIGNTLLVFTADHGDLCGEHGRLNKGNPYEGSAKIPFLLYYPAKVKAGTVVPQVLSCVDFLPTVLTLLGCRTAGKEQGRDASALFQGQASPRWNDIAFLRGTSGSKWLCAVTGRYKLIFSPQDRPWLLDREKDPEELTNFFADPEHRAAVRRLAKELAEYCRKYGDPYADIPKIRSGMEAALS